jgi:uncharacterized repeat protein (TIGR02543 family)
MEMIRIRRKIKEEESMGKTKRTTWKQAGRRLFSLLLAFVMCVTCLPLTSLADPVEPATTADDLLWTDFAEEITPTAEGVYEIRTAGELAWVSKQINDQKITQYKYDWDSDSYTYTVFRLKEDIDLSAHQWMPIGLNSQKGFEAIFDGEGHTITGMRIGSKETPFTDSWDAGLFGCIEGFVNDLKIADSAIYADMGGGFTETYAGLLAGCLYGSKATVTNCEVSGSVYTAGTTYSNSDYGAAGGLLGVIERGTVDSCKVDVTLGLLNTTRSFSMAGIAPTAGNNYKAVIKNCVAVVNIDVPEDVISSDKDADGFVCSGGKAELSNSIVRIHYGNFFKSGYEKMKETYRYVTGKNVCYAESQGDLTVSVNDPDDFYYRYYDAAGEKQEFVKEEMKSDEMVNTLNAAASDMDGALDWSRADDENGGFPTLKGAGLHTYYQTTFKNLDQVWTSMRAISGRTLTEPKKPEREGYTFLYWVDEEDNAWDFATPVTKDQTLTAKWDPHMYTINFESDGGTYIYPQNVARDTKLIAPEIPTKKGASFGGWFTDSAFNHAYDFDSPVTEDFTLYAKWTGAQAGAVSGRVTDSESGEGIPGANVSLHNGQNASTDEFGYYRIENVAEGTYNILVTASGYEEKAKPGFTVSGTAANLDMALTKSESSQSGAPTANVYTTVSCVYSGIMLKGVQVKAVGEGDLGTYTQTTDENGFTLFMGLPAGTYTFYVNQAGRPGWEAYVSDPQDLEGDFNLNCALKPNYQEMTVTVQGSYDPVTEQTGQPIAGAKVSVVGVDPTDETKELVHLSAVTGEDGTVHMDKLVPITWKVSGKAFAYQETMATVYSNGAGKLSRNDLTLTLPFVESALTVNLESPYADPDIFKKTGEGEAASLKVTLAGVAGTLSEGIEREGSLNEEGKVVFTKLLPGTYHMTVSGAAKRYVDITNTAGQDILGSYDKKYFEVDFDGAGSTNVGLGKNKTVKLNVTPSPVSFSGTLYKSDMNADGTVTTVPMANTKLTIKPSEYYRLNGEAAKGHEIVTDNNGHYALTLWPGLYGAEVEMTNASDYTGGTLTYYEGMTAEWTKGEYDYYGYAVGWPSADKWTASKASAQAWLSGQYGSGGDIGGMNLSSGNVVADLTIMEKKVSFTWTKPFVNPGATTNMITGFEQTEEKETYTTDPFYATKLWKNSYLTSDYHPESKGATVSVKGAMSKEIDMTGRSFPLVFNELAPGDYTFTYTMDPVRFAHLTIQDKANMQKKISFYDFPQVGKLPSDFPEDYAKNKNLWPLGSAMDDNVIIDPAEGIRKIEDLYDDDNSNGEVKFKFWNLNYYQEAQPGIHDTPRKPKGYVEPEQTDSAGMIPEVEEETVQNVSEPQIDAEVINQSTWAGVPKSRWTEYLEGLKGNEGEPDVHWRWKTMELGELTEAVYDDTNMPKPEQYYELESSYGYTYGYGSKVYKPAACEYPKKPVYPDDYPPQPDSSDSKYYQHHREAYTYTDDDGHERIGYNEWDEFLTAKYNADVESWNAECQKIDDAYDKAVEDFATALQNAKDKYEEDYAAWYQNEYTGKGFPKKGCLYYCPDMSDFRAHWDDYYASMGNYVNFYTGNTTYFVGYTTELDDGKLFTANKLSTIPEGKTKLYFCAPRGKGEKFLSQLNYIRNQENYEELYNSSLWFCVNMPADWNGLINCDVNFAEPEKSKNVTILSENDVKNLLNPRTIKVQAIEYGQPDKVLDVPVSITVDDKTFSSSQTSGYPQQTCSSVADSVTVSSDEWMHDGSTVRGFLDKTEKTEIFQVGLTRKQYVFKLTVKDDAGNPVKGALVKLTGKDRGTPFERQTKADGTLQIGTKQTTWLGEEYVSGGITVQDYDITISAKGYGAQKLSLKLGDFPGSLEKSVTLTRQTQPVFVEDSVSVDRKGAFIPGVNFIGGSTNQIEFLTNTVLGSSVDNPLLMTVEAQIDTGLNDALQEVYLVDKKAFQKKDHSDKPKEVKVPSAQGAEYNPSEILEWIEKLRSGGLGDVYYKRFSETGSLTAEKANESGGSHYALYTCVNLSELPPDAFEPCLIAVTSNDAVAVYHFDYSGEKEKEQLVGIRMNGDKKDVLDNITIMANSQAAGGSMVDHFMEMTTPTGTIFPMPTFEAAIEEEEGYLSYTYKLGIKMLQGQQDVSGPKSASLSVAPNTLGIAVAGELSMSLNGEEREMTDGYNVTVSAEELDLMDYLPPMFASLPVKIEFDSKNPPSGSFTLTDTDTKDKNNQNVQKTYTFSANSQVHVNAEVSAFKSLAAVPTVGPVLVALEKSGALDMGVQVKVAAGADGTYKYTIIGENETEHEVSFTVGAGAGLGLYAKAFGGSVGAEANVKLSGNNEKLEDMVTVTAVIDKDGFQLKDVSGKITADAHIEIETWFINGEKDFKFGEIPFKYEFNTATQCTVTPIRVTSTMKSRNDFGTSKFNGKPETIVSDLLPLGGYASDEADKGTFLYTDMSKKGGDVRLQLVTKETANSWVSPATITQTSGLIPAFDVISLEDGRYLAVWTEIPAESMEKSCPPSTIKYAVGTVKNGSWSGDVQTVKAYDKEVASKLLLVKDNTGVSLVTKKTAEGAMAEKLDISGFKFDGAGFGAESPLASKQVLYDIQACAAGGAVFVSFVTEDLKHHLLKWSDIVTEATSDVTGFETAMVSNGAKAYALSETESGLALFTYDSEWKNTGIFTTMADCGNPTLTLAGDRVVASWSAEADRSLYMASMGTDGEKATEAKEVKAVSKGSFADSTVFAEGDSYTVMTVQSVYTDNTNDRRDHLNTYTVKASALAPAHEHDYTVTYDWSADGKSCTAQAVCKSCEKGTEGHEIKEEATVSGTMKTDSTTTTKGWTTYTAVFTNSLFETQTKDVQDIPVKDPTDPEETIVTAPDSKEPVYTGSAQKLVTEGVAVEGSKIQYQLGTSETLLPTGAWSDTVPEGTDAGDYYVWYRTKSDSSDAKCVKVTIAKGTQDKKPDVSGFTITDTTDYETADGAIDGVNGTMEYSVDNGTSWTKIETGSTKITGLAVGDVMLRFAETKNLKPGEAVTVRIGSKAVCEHEQGFEKTDAKAASCMKPGNSEYWTCPVCKKHFADDKGTKEIKLDETVVAALGHDYDVTYQWSTDGKSCTALAICKREGCTEETEGHKITENAMITGKVKKDSTTTAKGVTTYTAEFTKELFETQMMDVEDIPVKIKPVDPTPTPQPEKPATGTAVTDQSGSNGMYVVVSKGTDKPAVEYTGTKTASGTVTIPATIVANGVTYSVTSVAQSAFKNNVSITSVTIGSNVTTIENSAFENCKSLTGISIPAGVTTVGNSAFAGCTALKSATIGAKVTEIGDKAFAKCTSLTKITIPAKVESIGAQAFEGDKKLKSVKIGGNVTEIKDKAFANCPALTKLVIPARVVRIGKQICKGDKKLKSLTIKSKKLTAKSVKSGAFKGIPATTKVKVPGAKKKDYAKFFYKKGLPKKIRF